MKKVFILAALTVAMLIMNGCSGSEEINTSNLSEKLKTEYEFYEDSIGNIKSTMGLSQEEADNVFAILVSECGVDEKMQYVFNGNSDNTYTVWAGLLQLEVTLNDNAVETVMRGTEKLYPAAIVNETKSTEAKTNEDTHLSAYQLVSMDGHPVLYDYISAAHEFWDDYAEGRIDFDGKGYKPSQGQCVLSMETYKMLERNQKEHMIRSFDIHVDKELSLDEGLDLAKSYVPMDILVKFYALEWSKCYCKNEYCLYSLLYKPTKNGKKAIKEQNLDYNYVMVIIDVVNDYVTDIKIDSVYSMSRHIDEYKEINWEYDFLDE